MTRCHRMLPGMLMTVLSEIRLDFEGANQGKLKRFNFRTNGFDLLFKSFGKG